MTLCDTGPIVALIDEDDANHTRCVAALGTLPPRPLLTTWPCLAEAMYLLGRAGGFPAQDKLWAYIANGLLTIAMPEESDWQRMRALVQQYQDTPMDFADASLVVAAERHGFRRIFTLDSHFYAYRLQDRNPFEVVP